VIGIYIVLHLLLSWVRKEFSIFNLHQLNLCGVHKVAMVQNKRCLFFWVTKRKVPVPIRGPIMFLAIYFYSLCMCACSFCQWLYILLEHTLPSCPPDETWFMLNFSQSVNHLNFSGFMLKYCMYCSYCSQWSKDTEPCW
jgi:hypothetical protein